VFTINLDTEGINVKIAHRMDCTHWAIMIATHEPAFGVTHTRIPWRRRVERPFCFIKKHRLSVDLFQSDRGQNG